ncbi:MAG: Nramp family divalent metal transporter [Planctomycetota bacterium]|nr:Nramp family divalent metal transporter [Planctomycetota bacterium]
MQKNESQSRRPPWWKSIGPALITACVVFGPGSLLISSNVGAAYGYDLLWLLMFTGLMMGVFLTMGARIGVVGGATPCTLIAQRLGRPAAALVGLTLCLICATFQFSNNLAVVAAVEASMPKDAPAWIVPTILVAFNLAIIVFLFTAQYIYQALERMMKFMVGIILLCFVFNLVAAQPNILAILQGFIPKIPEPQFAEGKTIDPIILIASLLGTTLSVAGAFFQGNLVREKNWSIDDYKRSVGDSIFGVCVLTGISMIIMVTAATVIRGQAADNIGTLASALQPLLGDYSYIIFCIGLVAVCMNPFLINAMIGGAILSDGIGKPARLSDRLPRIFTVAVMFIGMSVALASRLTGLSTINLIIFGQALTVLGNPLMALSLLWLANQKDIMGDRRNTWKTNLLGGVGLLVVLFVAVVMIWRIYMRVTG